MVQLLLVVAPAVTTFVAILTASEPDPVIAVSLNVAAGIIISLALAIALSIVARQVADARMNLAQATGEGLWRARAQLLSIHDDESGLYVDWYLRLRIQEEIERSQRYDRSFAVIRIMASELRNASEQVESDWLSDELRNELRQSDIAALLKDGSIGIMLPGTDRSGAELVKSKLAGALASVSAKVGLACFPDDGKDAVALLTATEGDAAVETPQAASA
jgi:GGDEF domain-containing protein